MSEEIGIADLRKNLSRILDRVRQGENVYIQERGKTFAVVQPATELEAPVHEHIPVGVPQQGFTKVNPIERQRFIQKQRDEILRRMNRK